MGLADRRPVGPSSRFRRRSGKLGCLYRAANPGMDWRCFDADTEEWRKTTVVVFQLRAVSPAGRERSRPTTPRTRMARYAAEIGLSVDPLAAGLGVADHGRRGGAGCE